MSILYLVVILGGTLGFMFFMRRRLATQYAHMRAGQVVQRLGLQLVEGPAEHNLVTRSVQPSVNNVTSAKGFLGQMVATSIGGSLGEFKLRAVGQPYGARSELVLYCRQELTPGLTENTTTTWYDLRLTVYARSGVPPFDLRLRGETRGLETRRVCDAPRLPEQRFGDPVLDQRFAIETADPALPRRIASALAPIAHTLAYVHIVGEGDHVSFVMTPQSVMAAAMTFDRVLHALVGVAAVCEGRAVPPAMAAA